MRVAVPAPAPRAEAEAAPTPAIATAAPPRGRRYWKQAPPPTDSQVYVFVIDARELTIVASETVRVAIVEDVRTEGSRTRLTVRSPGRTVECVLDEQGPGRAEFGCSDTPRYALVELDQNREREEVRRIDRLITELMPPADACARAERCCVAAWPLLVPGEKCNVADQLGPDYFPDVCVSALSGLHMALAAQGLNAPEGCR